MGLFYRYLYLTDATSLQSDMYGELSRGDWRNGITQLNIVDGSTVEPVQDYTKAKVGYEFRSKFKDDTRNPPAVRFTPAELRAMIEQVKSEVDDPFAAPDFEPLRGWLETHGDDVIAEVGHDDSLRKQFRMKWNDDTGTPYLKVQRRRQDSKTGDDSWLISSPTLGPGEFEGVFEDVSVP
jgi:hypothetical protein